MGGRGATFKKGSYVKGANGWKIKFNGGSNVKESKRKASFNEMRFGGMDRETVSNKYMAIRNVSADGNRIAVRVGADHLRKTPYGWALEIGTNKVAYVKDWQVEINEWGNNVVLNRSTYQPRDSKIPNSHLDFEKTYSFDDLKKIAKSQGYTKWKR